MEEELQPHNIIPSQAYFGNNEILFHTAQFVSGSQRQQIKKISFNAYNQHTKWLCQKISQETYHLSKQVKQSQYTQEQCIVFYIKRILKHIVNDADQSGMLMEHKVLYLTFKYLSHLICKRAPHKSIPKQNLVSIYQWLSDANVLICQSAISSEEIDENSEDKLVQLLKKKDYEGLLTIMTKMGSNESNQLRKKKIQLINKLLSLKLDNYDLQFEKGTFVQNIRASNRLSFENLQSEYNKLFASQKSNSFGSNKDILQRICQILLGNRQSLRSLVDNNWPLMLSHIIDRQEQKMESKAIKDLVVDFLSLSINKSKLSNVDQYFIDLISDRNLHIVYQSLLGLVSPYYAHVIAYYFYFFYESSPLLTIMQNSYVLEMTANMLQHSSLVSHICLFLTFSFLQNNELASKNGQSLQALLYYHLSIVDIDDQEEVQLFIKKIYLLSKLNKQKYGFTHSKMFFNSLIRKNKLNSFVLSNLLFVASIYQKYYNFQDQIKKFVEEYFKRQELSDNDLSAIRELKRKLSGSKKFRKQLTLLNRLEPHIHKFQLLQLATVSPDPLYQQELVIQLIKNVTQSRPLLSLILSIIIKRNLKTVDLTHQYKDQNRPQYYLFMRHVQVFIHHYPLARSKEQQDALKRIEARLNQ